jgi:hypothetical protein
VHHTSPVAAEVNGTLLLPVLVDVASMVEKTRRAGLNWQRLGLRLARAGLLAVTGAIHLDLYLTGYRSIR